MILKEKILQSLFCLRHRQFSLKSISAKRKFIGGVKVAMRKDGRQVPRVRYHQVEERRIGVIDPLQWRPEVHRDKAALGLSTMYGQEMKGERWKRACRCFTPVNSRKSGVNKCDKVTAGRYSFLEGKGQEEI